MFDFVEVVQKSNKKYGKNLKKYEKALDKTKKSIIMKDGY